MTVGSLDRFLKKHHRVGLDSNILIYFIEGAPTYKKLTQRIFESIEAGQNQGVCSTLTLLEILVQPYRKQNEALLNEFYGLLTTYPNLEWMDMTVDIADTGARLRAEYGLKTPDSIVLATALRSEVTGFIANDAQFKKVEELDVMVLNG